MHSDTGATFEHTFDSSGVSKYYCTPHKAMGMKGAVVVGDADASLGGNASNESAGAANGSATNESADGESPGSFDGWFAETANYEGVVDETGTDVVTVKVGAEGNGGPFAFDPPAIHIDPDTTVVWEWVSGKNPHDVVDSNDRYRSEKAATAGDQFAMNFGGDGLSKYECTTAGARGMRGAIVVGRGVVPGLGPKDLVVTGGAAAVLGGAVHQGMKIHNETTTGPWQDEQFD